MLFRLVFLADGQDYDSLFRAVLKNLPADDKYDYVGERQKDGVISVKLGEKNGLLDRNLNVIFPCVYDLGFSDECDYSILKKDGKYGWVNNKWEVIVPCIYDDVEWGRRSCDWYIHNRLWDTVNQVRLNGKWGRVNYSGRVVTPIVYDSIFCCNRGYYAVKNNGLWGVIDNDNQFVFSFKYENILQSFDPRFIFAVKDEKVGAINLLGEVVIPFEYDRLEDWLLWSSKGVFILRKEHLWGVVDTFGHILVPFKFEKVSIVEAEDNSMLFCAKTDSVDIYFDSLGNKSEKRQKVVTQRSYDYSTHRRNVDTFLDACPKQSYTYVGSFSQGLARVEDCNGKSGFIDRCWEEVIPCIYEYCGDFLNGLAKIRLKDKTGYINREGVLVIDTAYKSIQGFRNEQFIVNSDAGFALLDANGTTKKFSIYDEYSFAFSGFISVRKNGKWGLTDRDGKLVVECKYNEPLEVWDGLLLAVDDSGGSYIDTFGNVVLEESDTVSFCYSFSDGLARVADSNLKVGFMNRNGRIVIPMQFYNAGRFFDGLAWCSFHGGDFEGVLIDSAGRVLGDRFYGGYAQFRGLDLVIVEGTFGYGLISKCGKQIIPCLYENLDFSECYLGLLRAKLNGKWGFIDTTGKTLIPHIYDEVTDFSEGLIGVKKDGVWGYIDGGGNDVVWFNKADK